MEQTTGTRVEAGKGFLPFPFFDSNELEFPGNYSQRPFIDSSTELMNRFRKRLREQDWFAVVWMRVRITGAFGEGTFEWLFTIDPHGGTAFQEWVGSGSSTFRLGTPMTNVTVYDLATLCQHLPVAIVLESKVPIRRREVLVKAGGLFCHFYWEPGKESQQWFASLGLAHVGKLLEQMQDFQETAETKPAKVPAPWPSLEGGLRWKPDLLPPDVLAMLPVGYVREIARCQVGDERSQYTVQMNPTYYRTQATVSVTYWTVGQPYDTRNDHENSVEHLYKSLADAKAAAERHAATGHWLKETEDEI